VSSLVEGLLTLIVADGADSRAPALTANPPSNSINRNDADIGAFFLDALEESRHARWLPTPNEHLDESEAAHREEGQPRLASIAWPAAFAGYLRVAI